MCVNPAMCNMNNKPVFIREIQGAGGKNNSFVNINDIANIHQISDNHWEAQGINGTNIYGGPVVYHFDNASAGQIINYMTGNILPS